MTTNYEREHADLNKADRHIADGERHITEQEARIAKLRADGQDVKAFEDVLASFKAMLVAQREHRDVILERIAQLDTETPESVRRMKSECISPGEA